jgi:4-amino-4-deoxy-L-arabinose transferase-like glycosyltransferase
MNVEIHAPSQLLLVVSLALVVLALLCFFVVPDTTASFWMAIAAYCVMGIGTIVKT